MTLPHSKTLLSTCLDLVTLLTNDGKGSLTEVQPAFVTDQKFMDDIFGVLRESMIDKDCGYDYFIKTLSQFEEEPDWRFW